jgi:hypothetical protein
VAAVIASAVVQAMIAGTVFLSRYLFPELDQHLEGKLAVTA